jgi:hypothetical protein
MTVNSVGTIIVVLCYSISKLTTATLLDDAWKLCINTGMDLGHLGGMSHVLQHCYSISIVELLACGGIADGILALEHCYGAIMSRRMYGQRLYGQRLHKRALLGHLSVYISF